MEKKYGVLAILGLAVSIALTGCGGTGKTSGTATTTPAQAGKSTTAAAKKFELPSGDMNILVPVAAGGGTDLTWRALAKELEGVAGKTVVVENKPGAGSSIGLGEAARKKADGLNLMSYTSEIFTLPIFQQTSFTAADFKPILLVNFDPASVVVPADSPYKTLEDLIEDAKKNPGKVTIGNSGFGNIWHLSASAFEEQAGIKLNHVPFEGSAPTVSAALGGHIKAFVASPPEVAGQVEAGKLRILVVMSDERLKKFPDVPTLKEKNINLSIGTWRGLGVPKGTPDEAIPFLHEKLAQAVKTENFQKFMAERGLGIKYMNTEEFNKFIAEQRPQFEALAKKIKETQQK